MSGSFGLLYSGHETDFESSFDYVAFVPVPRGGKMANPGVPKEFLISKFWSFDSLQGSVRPAKNGTYAEQNSSLKIFKKSCSDSVDERFRRRYLSPLARGQPCASQLLRVARLLSSSVP